MSTNGATMNYKFGMKANWRRTVHNQILQRLNQSPRECVVLYLAGPQDLDRPEFLRRRFRPDNLIAVERDSRLCTSLRSDGKLCIYGDINAVIAEWKRTRVDVVFADLCCGLHSSFVETLIQLTRNHCFHRAVLAVNLLRGRDADSNELRAELSGDDKHRGRAFARLYAAILTESVVRTQDEMRSMFCRGTDADGIGLSLIQDAITKMTENVSWLWHASYRSDSGQYFDSCVFQNATVVGLWDDLMRRANEGVMTEELNSHIATMVEEYRQKMIQMTDSHFSKSDPRHAAWMAYIERQAAELPDKMRTASDEATMPTRQEIEKMPTATELCMSLQNITTSPLSRQLSAIKATRTRRLNRV